jgi:DNA polymerase V
VVGACVNRIGKEYTTFARLKPITRLWPSPVSVGIAATKTLAKVASHRANKDPSYRGVFLMPDEPAVDAELAHLTLTDIWGIAGQLARRLVALGIDTPLALKQADARFIRERFSVTLERTVRELQGTPCIALEEGPPDRKTIVASRSFGRMVTERHEMEEAVASYATRAAEKMRRQDLAAGRVMLLDLVKADRVQGALFARPDSARSQARMRAVDSLNRRFGRDTVRYAAAGVAHGWTMQRASLSPRFTTSWDELLTVSDVPQISARC